MTKKAAVTEAEMKRAMTAAQKSGLVVRECIMTANDFKLIFTDPEHKPVNTDTRQPEAWD